MYNKNIASFGLESSSRTTSLLPQPISSEGAFEITGISNYADNLVIKTSGDKSWDEIIEEVLLDRAEAWEKLAGL